MTQPETGEPRNEEAPGSSVPVRSRNKLVWASVATAVVIATGLGIGLGLTTGGAGPSKAAGGTAAGHSRGSGAATTTSVPATTTRPSTSTPATRTTATPTTATPPVTALRPGRATYGLKSGIYTGVTKGGSAGTPHYIVSLTKATSTSLEGSVQFVEQDGKTETAFTFTGQGGRQLALLRPAAPTGTGSSTVTTGTLPKAIPALISQGTIKLDRCSTYLRYATSTSDCTFTYSTGGHP